MEYVRTPLAVSHVIVMVQATQVLLALVVCITLYRPAHDNIVYIHNWLFNKACAPTQGLPFGLHHLPYLIMQATNALVRLFCWAGFYEIWLFGDSIGPNHCGSKFSSIPLRVHWFNQCYYEITFNYEMSMLNLTYKDSSDHAHQYNLVIVITLILVNIV